MFGGTCLNAGCIPSKALLESSELYHKTQDELGVHGIKVGGRRVRRRADAEAQDGHREASTSGIALLFKSAGVTALQGHGKLLAGTARWNSPRTTARQQTLTAQTRRARAAARFRSSCKSMPFDGKNIVDSWGALDFETRAEEARRDRRRRHRPRARQRVAPARRRSRGARSARHLPRDRRPGTREGSRAAFQEAGPRHQARRESVGREVERERRRGQLRRRAGSQTITVDKLIVAVGRRPFTKNLLADGTGVQLDERGFIEVDEHCQTGVPKTSGPSATACAARCSRTRRKEEGVMVGDLIAGTYGHMNYDTIPSVIYTHPEIAWVGQTEEQVKASGRAYKVGQFPFAASGRARAMEATAGLREADRRAGRRRDPRRAHRRADGRRADRRGRARDGIFGQQRRPAAHDPRAPDACPRRCTKRRWRPTSARSTTSTITARSAGRSSV